MRTRSRVTLGAAIAVAVVVVIVGWVVIGAPPDAQHPSSSSNPSATPSPPAPAQIGPQVPPTPQHTYSSYVALGDSYAAGEGGGDERGVCQRSAEGYPGQLAAMPGIPPVRNEACSGATTADVLATQLSTLNDTTALVTLTIGGNDLDAIGVAAACRHGATSGCSAQFHKAMHLLTIMPARLKQTMAAVANAAPNARIIVTGYPELYRLPPSSSPKFATLGLIASATVSLNGMLSKAAEDEHKAGVNVKFVAIDFTGHRLGSDDPWLHAQGVTAYHPTKAGYQAYARAIASVL